MTTTDDRAARRDLPDLRPQDLGMGVLFWSIRDAVVVGDAVSGDVVLWSPSAETLFGYPAEEIVGQPIEVLVPDAFKEEHRAGLARYTTTGRGTLIDAGTPVELPARRKDGTEIAIELTLGPIAAPGLGERLVLAVVRDVTERKRAQTAQMQLAREQAARTAAEAAAATLQSLQAVTDAALGHLALEALLDALLTRLREVVGTDTAAVLLLDEAGTTLIARAAKGLEEEVERGVRIPLGQGFAGRIAAERRVIALAEVNHANVLNPILREKGVRSLLGAPLLVEGRVLGVVHVGTLTPRRFDEGEARLLHLVADRMALAIDQARLYEAERQARAEAEEAVAARDRFLSLAAHELRTPITIVKGIADLLLRPPRGTGTDPERRARLLRRLAESATRLATLTDDLLDVSRLRLGRLPLRLTSVDLGELAQSATTRYADRLEGRGAPIVTGGEGCKVVGDRDRIEQVLSNLLDNAVKYSPGGGQVAITVAPEGEGVRVVVRDEGIGLPPGVEETIFEPFGRAANVTSLQLPGLGLGLYLCRELVERHGGWIRAESAGEGQGTTVTVWLPRSGSDGGSQEAAEPAPLMAQP